MPQLEAPVDLYFVFREFIPYGKDIVRISTAMDETPFFDVALSSPMFSPSQEEANALRLDFLLPEQGVCMFLFV